MPTQQPNQEQPMPPSVAGREPDRVRAIFASVSRRYDLANHLLSLGLDRGWRIATARTVAGWKPRRILDLATGSGDLALALMHACPEAEVTGADFCAPMLDRAREKGVRNLVEADGMKLPFADSAFDAVSVAFGLRNMADYRVAVGEMARVIAPGGGVAVLDFSLPGPILRPAYRFYLHCVLPLVAGWITGDRKAYEYLGGSIEQFPSGAAMVRLLEECGFTDAHIHSMACGVVSLYTARKTSRC